MTWNYEKSGESLQQYFICAYSRSEQVSYHTTYRHFKIGNLTFLILQLTSEISYQANSLPPASDIWLQTIKKHVNPIIMAALFFYLWKRALWVIGFLYHRSLAQQNVVGPRALLIAHTNFMPRVISYNRAVYWYFISCMSGLQYGNLFSLHFQYM